MALVGVFRFLNYFLDEPKTEVILRLGDYLFSIKSGHVSQNESFTDTGFVILVRMALSMHLLRK